jgi:hypothetical protein
VVLSVLTLECVKKPVKPEPREGGPELNGVNEAEAERLLEGGG